MCYNAQRVSTELPHFMLNDAVVNNIVKQEWSLKEPKKFQLIDSFSSYSICRAIKTKKSSEIAVVLEDIFSVYGIPKRCLSDNGGEFKKNVLTEIKKFGVDPVAV